MKTLKRRGSLLLLVILSLTIFIVILHSEGRIEGDVAQDSRLFEKSLVSTIQEMENKGKLPLNHSITLAKSARNIAGSPMAYTTDYTCSYTCGSTCGYTSCGSTCSYTCGSTCGYTCSYTCIYTCSNTCAGNYTCGATVCGSTCSGATACSSTCAGEYTCGVTVCGSTCGTTSCGTTCGGATCGTTCSNTCTSPPLVTYFAINNGASSTTSLIVTLNNTTTNSPTEYMASHSSTFAGATWQPYSAAPSFTMSAGGSTIKKIYFKTRNACGVSNVKSDTIVYTGSQPCTAPPVVTSFAINNGAASTTSQAVTLNNISTGNPTEYIASENASFTGAGWQPYSTAPSFTLSTGYGTKTVYFKTKNACGESNVMSDTIQYSAGGTCTSPPVVTSFAINNGASSTTSLTVTLNNTTTNSPTEYMASHSSTFAGATWQPYSPAPAFTMSAGGSTIKKIYFKTRNACGVSNVKSDTIVFTQTITSFMGIFYYSLNTPVLWVYGTDGHRP